MGRVQFHDSNKGLVYLNIRNSTYVLTENEFEYFLKRQEELKKPLDKWTDREARDTLKMMMTLKLLTEEQPFD